VGAESGFTRDSSQSWQHVRREESNGVVQVVSSPVDDATVKYIVVKRDRYVPPAPDPYVEYGDAVRTGRVEQSGERPPLVTAPG
jgi:hypothetical protein